MTIKELASLAGVSVSTVSKIMNGKDSSISTKTREHVLQLAKECNYIPYASASTHLRKTLTIGVILRDSTRVPFLVPGILAAATANGYSVLLRESVKSAEAEFKNISAMIAAHVDGVIWEPVAKSGYDMAVQLERAGIPYIKLDIPPNSIYPAFKEMGYMAAQALVKKHHINIACIRKDQKQDDEFFQGYLQCLFENQLPFRQELVFSDAGDLPISGISSHMITGIVISDSEEAAKLYRNVTGLHFSVPQDLSIVSLRNDPEGQSHRTEISSISVPYYSYSRQAARNLIAKIEKKETVSEWKPELSVDHQNSIDIPGTFRRKGILSIGSVNVDHYLNFETLPQTGRTATSSNSSTYPGGKCINQAMGAAKLGHAASIIGRVGSDADSDMIYRAIKDFQIDSYGLKRTNDSKTGQAYIFVQKNGESMISILSGANNMVSAEDIKNCSRLFSSASYCLIQTEIPMDAVVEAAETARRHGLTTVVKPSSCHSLPERLLRNIDILVPNADELSILFPEKISMEEKAARLFSHGIKTVIVTTGADGCNIFEPGRSCHIKAADFLPVDNTGAADAFISALVSYLLYDYDIVTAARIANYAAGLSITRQGVAPALVDKSTLEAYLKINDPGLLKYSEN